MKRSQIFYMILGGLYTLAGLFAIGLIGFLAGVAVRYFTGG